MELKIGENIKRLRRNKGITQEQLAELLDVSCAAVSKWENSNTYPDISAIIPLARVFGVSIDELMGYNSERDEEEIGKIIDKHIQLRFDRKIKEATELITEARRAYPNSYQIMSRYLCNFVEEGSESMNARWDDLLQVCDCILEGCTDERLRLETISMKAKIYHAGGDTKKALEILSQLPTWGQNAEFRMEGLYEKDTEEYRYWGRHNLYRLADLAASKIVRNIWYEEGITMEERLVRCEIIGDMFKGMREKTGESVFAIFEHMIFAELSGKLTFFGGNMEDILRTQEKKLIAARELTQVAKQDDILSELLVRTYKTDDILQWTKNWLRTAPQEPLVRLRENHRFMEMLERV